MNSTLADNDATQTTLTRAELFECLDAFETKHGRKPLRIFLTPEMAADILPWRKDGQVDEEALPSDLCGLNIVWNSPTFHLQ